MRQFDTGERFGLPPIGTSGINESAPQMDTVRHKMPGLATKGSVFTWLSSPVQLLSRSAAGQISETINIRRNTATNGSSADVPTWAAGAVISLAMFVNSMGTSTYWNWVASSVVAGSVAPAFSTERNAVSNVSAFQQVIMPFYDDPSMTIETFTNGTGTSTTTAYLMGFVRNV